MFKCEACSRVVQAGQPSREVVLEIRQKSYPAYEPPSSKKRHKKKRSGATGFGWETARSARVCISCAPELEAKLVERVSGLAVPQPEVLAEAS